MDLALFYHYYPGLNPFSLTVARYLDMCNKLHTIRRMISGDKDLEMDMMGERTERELMIEAEVERREA